MGDSVKSALIAKLTSKLGGSASRRAISELSDAEINLEIKSLSSGPMLPAAATRIANLSRERSRRAEQAAP